MDPACPTIPTGAHDIPDSLDYDHQERLWGAKRGIGRPLTPAEYDEMQRLNAARVRPQ